MACNLRDDLINQNVYFYFGSLQNLLGQFDNLPLGEEVDALKFQKSLFLKNGSNWMKSSLQYLSIKTSMMDPLKPFPVLDIAKWN